RCSTASGPSAPLQGAAQRQVPVPGGKDNLLSGVLPSLNLLFQGLRRICFRVSQVRTTLVWQVCLASVCLHIRRKSSCILCVPASRRVCTVPLLPNCSPSLYRFLRVLCSCGAGRW